MRYVLSFMLLLGALTVVASLGCGRTHSSKGGPVEPDGDLKVKKDNGGK